LAALLCELCGYKLLLFSASAVKAKAFNREDRKGNAKIAKKIPTQPRTKREVRMRTQPFPTIHDQLV
jgi:hypothetical protein